MRPIKIKTHLATDLHLEEHSPFHPNPRFRFYGTTNFLYCPEHLWRRINSNFNIHKFNTGRYIIAAYIDVFIINIYLEKKFGIQQNF
jgi:hypothetical protein